MRRFARAEAASRLLMALAQGAAWETAGQAVERDRWVPRADRLAETRKDACRWSGAVLDF